MAKNSAYEGNPLDFTPAADVNSGDIVTIGPMVGVSLNTTASGQLGAAKVFGVFDLPKPTAQVIAVGDLVNFDASASIMTTATTTAAGDVTGGAVCVRGAVNGDETVRVMLLPGSGVLS